MEQIKNKSYLNSFKLSLLSLPINASFYLQLILIVSFSLICGAFVIHYGLYSLYLIVGIILSFIILINSYLGLLFIISVFPILVGFSEDIGLAETAFIVLFSLWVTGWLLRLVQDRKNRLSFKWHPLTTPTLILGLLLFISALVGYLNGAQFADILRDLSKFIGYLMLFPVASIVKDQKKAFSLLILLFLIGVPSWIWNSVIWSARKFGYEYGAMNIISVGGEYLGPFLGALWPVVLLKTKRWLKTFSLIILMILFGYVLGSGYRHQILGFLIMSFAAIWGIWAVQTGIKKTKVVIPLITCVIFLFWIYYGTLGHLPLPGGEKTKVFYRSLIFTDELLQDSSFQGRLTESQAALNKFREYPLFGVGLGHQVEFQTKFGWFKSSFTHHIWQTELLMKFGLIGIIIFIYYFVSVLKFTFAVAKQSANPLVKAFILGIFVWMIKTITPTVGSFSSHGFIFTVGIMIAILPALVGWHIGFDVKKAKQKQD